MMIPIVILLFFAQAPTKPTNAEIIDSIRSGDAAARENTRTRQRAWAAYCAIAGEALATTTNNSPALLGLDPKLPNHSKLIAETVKTRDFLHAQLQKLPGAKSELQRQRVNYNRGLSDRSASPKDIAAFTKGEVFACSDGFELLWNTLAYTR